ncbi:MAG: HAD family hydrolase, partial [Angustibacter sp.]
PNKALMALRARMPSARFAVEDVHRGFRVTEHFPPGELQGEIRVVSFAELLDLPVVRCIMRSPEHSPADFLEVSAELGLTGASYAVGWSAWLDISPLGVDKAYGLASLADRLGYKAQDVLAIGDGRNDLSMFAWAGQSIAMGQAEDEVKAAADEVCGTVEQDGLAEILERLLR